jgi:hypothetical protein
VRLASEAFYKVIIFKVVLKILLPIIIRQGDKDIDEGRLCDMTLLRHISNNYYTEKEDHKEQHEQITLRKNCR